MTAPGGVLAAAETLISEEILVLTGVALGTTAELAGACMSSGHHGWVQYGQTPQSMRIQSTQPGAGAHRTARPASNRPAHLARRAPRIGRRALGLVRRRHCNDSARPRPGSRGLTKNPLGTGWLGPARCSVEESTERA